MQHLSWTFGSGYESRGGSQKNVSWHDVEEKIVYFLEHSGTVTLEPIDGGKVGSKNIQIQADGGFFVLLLGECDAEGYNVRNLTDSSAKGRHVDILGELWDHAFISNDFYIALERFREFFETGKVAE